MSDFYTEQIVKCQPSAKTMAIKVGLICLTVLAAIMGLFLIPQVLIVCIALIVVDIFFIPRLNVEYEYLYVNGDLDIDIIWNKQRRKNKYSMNINDLEVLAKAEASEVRNVQVDKTYDFSSRKTSTEKYVMIVSGNGEKVKVIFEPNQNILEGMKMMAPRKVTL